MKNKALKTLSEMIWDCLNEEDVSPEEVVRTVRSSLGDAVAWHKQSANKAQNALDELNKLPAPVISNQSEANDLYWLRPGGAASRDYAGEPFWYNDNGAYDNYRTQCCGDTISFTSARSNDTISLG